MSDKLYKVTIIYELVVLAKDADRARERAEAEVGSWAFDQGPDETHALQVHNVAGLPANWDSGCIPYGAGEDDRTIGEILQEKDAAK